MKQFQGVWFPDHETHFLEWMTEYGEIVDGRGTYQIAKLRAAVAFCQQRRVAIDIGAHVGLWSMQLSKMFTEVHAFEPLEEHRVCFDKNLIGGKRAALKRWLGLRPKQTLIDGVKLYPYALGDQEFLVSITHENGMSSGTSAIDLKDTGTIPVKTLDSFGFQNVDFIKIDTEGFEERVLAGATTTISNWRPVIIVEQKGDMASSRFNLRPLGAVSYLEEMGYRMAQEISGDYIMVPT
jgi:FkbM family methyltransferase